MNPKPVPRRTGQRPSQPITKPSNPHAIGTSRSHEDEKVEAVVEVERIVGEDPKPDPKPVHEDPVSDVTAAKTADPAPADVTAKADEPEEPVKVEYDGTSELQYARGPAITYQQAVAAEKALQPALAVNACGNLITLNPGYAPTN